MYSCTERGMLQVFHVGEHDSSRLKGCTEQSLVLAGKDVPVLLALVQPGPSAAALVAIHP